MRMYCDNCTNKHTCELFSRVYAHEVEFCRDYVDRDRIEWRRDWFEAVEDEFGEYTPDDFEF